MSGYNNDWLEPNKSIKSFEIAYEKITNKVKLKKTYIENLGNKQ